MHQGDSVSERPGVASPKVLLTATNRWATPARIAIGLSKAGCRVSAVCPARGHPLASTTVVERIFRYSSLWPRESLLRAIEATQPQVIVPCDDRAVQHLHEIHACALREGPGGLGLVKLLEYSLGPADSFAIISARHDLLCLAQKEGIRVPDTMTLKTADDLASWRSRHPLPWVFKCDGTFGGQGVRIAHTEADAGACLRTIVGMFGAARALKRALVNRDPFALRPWWQSQRAGISVQAYVRGRPANCGVLCWRGRVLAGIAVEVLSWKGETGPASIVRVVDNKEMMTAAERIAQRLRLSGFVGLDFVIEASTGAAYLIEMNPRCTPLTHLQLGPRRDMISALAVQLTGRAMPDVPPITRNDRIAYFPQAFRVKATNPGDCFEDIPSDQPALIRELLEPWPERTLLYRALAQASAVASAFQRRRGVRITHSPP